MRSLLILSVVLAVILGGHAYSTSWGRRTRNDHRLFRQTEIRNAVKNNYWNVNVKFPRAGTKNYYIISAIFVFDNFYNRSGAASGLLSGGPGYGFTTVNLRGPANRGIHSTIEIWGQVNHDIDSSIEAMDQANRGIESTFEIWGR